MPKYLIQFSGETTATVCPRCRQTCYLLTTRSLSLLVEGAGVTIDKITRLHTCYQVVEALPFRAAPDPVKLARVLEAWRNDDLECEPTSSTQHQEPEKESRE